MSDFTAEELKEVWKALNLKRAVMKCSTHELNPTKSRSWICTDSALDKVEQELRFKRRYEEELQTEHE